MSSMIDLAELRRRSAGSRGPAWWRSLDELAGSAEFQEKLDREFPSLAAQIGDPVSRRSFMKVMGASLGLLGLTGCFWKRPQGQIVPSVNPPDGEIPGRPMYFATAMPFDGFGKGVLALSREGRPIKIEGNPDHPASLGASDIFMQASVLDLYDPDRSHDVLASGEIAQWGEFYTALMARLDAKRGNGAGLRLLTGPTTSPTLIAQLQQFARQFPNAKWHQFNPLGHGADIFQQPADTIYDFTNAAVIVSFGNDFMYSDPGSVRYARQFTDGRRVRADKMEMNRLYVLESTLTITGSMADNRLPLRPSQMEPMAAALAAKLGVTPGGAQQAVNLPTDQQRWIAAMAADLQAARSGKSTLVLAGPAQTPATHAIVHAINQRLGNLGKTVLHIDPVASRESNSLKDLVADMQSGDVDTLLMLGVNPAYDAPADVPFAAALEAMSNRIANGRFTNFTASLSSHYDETAFRCQWHVPRAHYLESWGDVRAFDGTASIIQPLIAPLFAGKSDWEFMEALLGNHDRVGSEIIREHWRAHVGKGGNFEQWWVKTLQKGVVEGSAFGHRTPAPLLAHFSAQTQAATETQNGFEILFQPDPNIRAGEFANNAWLQELPKPFTKLTWDNAAAISIGTAQKLGAGREGGILRDGDVIRIQYRGRTLNVPVILLPGQADDLITLYFGYGRERGGQVMINDEGRPRGYSAYSLRSSDGPWFGGGADVSVTDRFQLLVVTRNHHAMSIHAGVPGVAPWLKPEVIAEPGDSDDDLEINNRKIIRTATLEDFQKDPHIIEKLDGEKKPLLSLYKGWNYDHGLQWGMSIDMTACMGCNACVIACQAENNIAVVGKEQVSEQREMHWIRIDDYFGGDLESPTIHHQPVPCMHCENAPCEYVCPVGATTHSDEGINEMTYNRCVGTRYCSNNCPYKVRRFNFLLYSDYATPTLKLLHNPDVTVRSRGVMEKCTYCIQRIDQTRIEMEKQVLDLQERARRAADPAERERLMKAADDRGREIVRNLQTACQQSCPTQAIVFGDIRDAGSDVAKLKKETTNYSLLTDLTTKPRTTYLAHITNPNPALVKGNGAAASALRLSPSPGTPGEGGGGGRHPAIFDSAAPPPSLPRSTGGGEKGSLRTIAQGPANGGEA
jgi:molybdopterin-containing oxidoreductase family iron-sulfur binding subunit